MSLRIGLIGLGTLFALTLVAAPVLWQIANRDAPAPVPEPQPPLELTPALIAEMQANLFALRQEVRELRARVDGLDSRTAVGLTGAAARPPVVAPTGAVAAPPEPPDQDDSLRNTFAQVVLIADRRSANDGLTVASPSFLRQTFGLPRQDLDDECRSITNPTLRGLIATEDVGPIRARMLAPALASLRRVFAEVEEFEPELYARIASSGSLCVRLIRGSSSSASAHAYGLAVDLNIDGQLDNFADGRTQLGLILMADFFKKEGWIWGAGFSREDSMHFEVSREKIEEWRRLGLL